MALASRLFLNHGQRGIFETKGIVFATSLLLLLLPSQTDAGCPFQNPFWFLDRQVWQRESRLDLLWLQAHRGDGGGQPGQDGPWQGPGEFAKVLSSFLIRMALGKLGTTRELQVRRLLPDWVLREGRQGRKWTQQRITSSQDWFPFSDWCSQGIRWMCWCDKIV